MDTKFSVDELHNRTYRDLQQLAKSLSLPCNVKKIYLVQLIYARKFQSTEEVNKIVQQVKFERQQQSQLRKFSTRKKKQLQATEITSTSMISSPSIDKTPKRPRFTRVQYSPEISNRRINTQSLRANLQKPKVSIKTIKVSDRVLRSCNQKVYKNYSSENAFLKVISQNSTNTRPISSTITSREVNRILQHRELYPSINITKCVVKKQKGCIQSSRCNVLANKSRLELVAMENTNNKATQTQIIAKYPSTHPVINKQIPNINYEYVQSLGFRRSDGTMSKINAVVLKNFKNTPKPPNYRNIEMTMQDLINSNIDTQTMSLNDLQKNPAIQYHEMSSTDIASPIKEAVTYADKGTDSMPFKFRKNVQSKGKPNTEYNSERNLTYNVPNEATPSSTQKDIIKPSHCLVYNDENEISCSDIQDEAYKETEGIDCPIYYHKKIRNERRISTQRECEQKLPRINEVFSKFNNVTQPIYVQVSEESERTISLPALTKSPNNSMNLLENLYNFKTQFLVNQPLLKIATVAKTKSVFTSSIVTTAKEQVPGCCDAFMTSREPLRQSCAETEATNLNTSESIGSLEIDYDFCTSPDRCSQATVPEMVEDALEFISQDGDYMERIGMDVRMQCILCSWAGPRFILEHHIRTVHPHQILKQDSNEWNITYSLGSLVQQQHWCSQVAEYQSVLYILSTKYEDPQYLLTAFTTLSTDIVPKIGAMTIYNKVTGEPYTWSGEIQSLPPSLPYYTDSVCLKLEMSTLNLLPNSANLQLINRELVIKSPSKVIVGNPELNSIHIILFVKILN